MFYFVEIVGSLDLNVEIMVINLRAISSPIKLFSFVSIGWSKTLSSTVCFRDLDGTFVKSG